VPFAAGRSTLRMSSASTSSDAHVFKRLRRRTLARAIARLAAPISSPRRAAPRAPRWCSSSRTLPGHAYCIICCMAAGENSMTACDSVCRLRPRKCAASSGCLPDDRAARAGGSRPVLNANSRSSRSSQPLPHRAKAHCGENATSTTGLRGATRSSSPVSNTRSSLASAQRNVQFRQGKRAPWPAQSGPRGRCGASVNAPFSHVEDFALEVPSAAPAFTATSGLLERGKR